MPTQTYTISVSNLNAPLTPAQFTRQVYDFAVAQGVTGRALVGSASQGSVVYYVQVPAGAPYVPTAQGYTYVGRDQVMGDYYDYFIRDDWLAMFNSKAPPRTGQPMIAGADDLPPDGDQPKPKPSSIVDDTDAIARRMRELERQHKKEWERLYGPGSADEDRE